MFSCNLDTLELDEESLEEDDSANWLASFPFNTEGPGESIGDSDSLSVVYNELQPGTYLGAHTDSATEVLVVLDGTVEIEIGDVSRTVSSYELVLIPAGSQHSVTNVGAKTARLFGCFGDESVDSSFEGTLVGDQAPE